MREIIPTHAISYDTLSFIHPQCVFVYKKVGYTPLQVVEEIKPYLLPEEASRCTYVGRLDPMAQGWMHVLWSGDSTEKEKYMKLDKTYEVDVVFGVSTDTGDILGFITQENTHSVFDVSDISIACASFVGSFTYSYPTYSSPHIKQTLRNTKDTQEKISEIKTDLKNQRGHIHSIDVVSCKNINKKEYGDLVTQLLSQVHMPGDFRLSYIQDRWKDFFNQTKQTDFTKITIRVRCASGTYMRTLSEQIGKKMGTCAVASAIRRIGIHG